MPYSLKRQADGFRSSLGDRIQLDGENVMERLAMQDETLVISCAAPKPAHIPVMTWLSRLAERQIQKTRLRGGMSGLAGEGRPLPPRTGEAYIDAGEAAALRMMAEAGILPEEIVLKKRVATLRAHLAELTGTAARKAAMAEIAALEMRQAIAEEARRRLMKG